MDHDICPRRRERVWGAVYKLTPAHFGALPDEVPKFRQQLTEYLLRSSRITTTIKYHMFERSSVTDIQ